MTELFKKQCKICGSEMMAKKYATMLYCSKCKESDEYKEIVRKKNEKRKNTTKNFKDELVEKQCKLCGSKIMAKRYTSALYCSDCKKTNEYKEIWKLRDVKYKKTVKEKYGVNNTFLIKDKDGKMKREKTYKEKYGASNPLKSKNILAKVRKTHLERYGVDNPFRDNEKIKKSYMDKWGVDNPNKVREIREKLEQTNMKKYGVKNNLSRPEILKKGRITRLKRYGCEYPYSVKYHYTKPHRVLKESLNFDNDFETEKTVRVDGKSYSLDEFDNKRKIVIFVDGDYWHGNPKKYKSDDMVKNKKVSDIWRYDARVKKVLEDNGYFVIRVWESDIYKNIGPYLFLIKTMVKQACWLRKIKRTSKRLVGSETTVVGNKLNLDMLKKYGHLLTI